MKSLVTAVVTICLGHLSRHNTNRSNPVCVMSPEVTKVSKTYLGQLWLFLLPKFAMKPLATAKVTIFLGHLR